MYTNFLKASQVLKTFNAKDFVLNKRANFLYYFILTALMASALLLLFTTLRQLTSYNKIQLQIAIPITALILACIFSLIALVRGRFSLASHVFVISIFTSSWVAMFLDRSRFGFKIDTIVYVFAGMSMLPLLVNSKKEVMIYGILNFFIFILFVIHLYLYQSVYMISITDIVEVFTDFGIAFLFSLVVFYNLFSINKSALDNAKKEIEHRKKISNELQYHKNNLERLVQEKTEDIEAANEELHSINEELYDKNQIINNKNIELEGTLKHLKKTQTQLFHAEKMASLGILTAGIAHEINNPLNYIMGAYVGLDRINKERTYDENEKQIAFLLQSIQTGIERVSNITSGLNQFSRDSKSLNEDCNIHVIINNCLTILYSQFKQRINIEKHFNPFDIILKGNIGNLHQVFINILVNAIHAIQGEGTIKIKTELANQKIIIIISDSGEGISPENIKKVTDPFFTTKEPGKGIGLGLSITYSIIQEHKGELELISELEKGTTVKILLPQNSSD